MNPIQILLAEDNPGDVFLVREALRRLPLIYSMTLFGDAESVKKYIDSVGTDAAGICPDVFLLDLNLPKGDGHDVLKQFRGNSFCAEIPVIIVTSSNAPRDRSRAAEAGASAYFQKPSNLHEFMELGPLVASLLREIPNPA